MKWQQLTPGQWVTVDEKGTILRQVLRQGQYLGGSASFFAVTGPGHVHSKHPTEQEAKAVAEASLVRHFVDDDHSYVGWLIGNKYGFVVNTYKVPSSRYLWLHFADCREINNSGGKNWTTTDYSKVCASNVEVLERWAEEELGGELTRCKKCWA